MRPLAYQLCRLAIDNRRRLTIMGVLFSILAIAATLASAQTIAGCLDKVNARRAQLGLYPLQLDLRLQAQAEYESVVRAERRITGHLPNGCSPGSAEGVGWSGRPDPYGDRFLTCFHAPRDYTRRYRYAGAAVAVSRRGQTFYTLILR